MRIFDSNVSLLILAAKNIIDNSYLFLEIVSWRITRGKQYLQFIRVENSES